MKTKRSHLVVRPRRVAVPSLLVVGLGRYWEEHVIDTRIGRFRYIASRAERRRFARNSVWAFSLAPGFPRETLTLCPQLCVGISHRRHTVTGPLNARFLS